MNVHTPTRCLTIVIVLIFGLTACSIPNDSEPRALAAEELPEGLQPAVPKSSTTVETGREIVRVWYQTDAQPVGISDVVRFVEEASLETAIESLLEPIPEDRSETLNNQWNDPAVSLIGLRFPAEDRMVVNLTAIPPAAEGALQGPTFAQLVWTATQVPFGVKTIRLEVDGEPQRMIGRQRPAQFIGRDAFPNQPGGAPPSTTTDAPRPTAAPAPAPTTVPTPGG